jgi:hypothetical protein
MLSATEVRHVHRRRRSPYSDKQHYQEYILQRIEGYKNSIGRDELLRLGDEAASELQATAEGQFVLTEVLMLESVDRLIMKRLSLRPYRRRRQHYIRLRDAQPAPTAYLLAAHDAAVTFLAGELGCVERVESRMAAEALSSLFDSYVTHFDSGLPGFLSFLENFDIVVLDPEILLELGVAGRAQLVSDLQRRSRAGGVHVILPTCSAIAPESLRSLYAGWMEEEQPKRKRRGTYGKCAPGLILAKPLCPEDTE